MHNTITTFPEEYVTCSIHPFKVYTEENRCTHWFPIPVMCSGQKKHTHTYTRPQLNVTDWHVVRGVWAWNTTCSCVKTFGKTCIHTRIHTESHVQTEKTCIKTRHLKLEALEHIWTNPLVFSKRGGSCLYKSVDNKLPHSQVGSLLSSNIDFGSPLLLSFHI